MLLLNSIPDDESRGCLFDGVNPQKLSGTCGVNRDKAFLLIELRSSNHPVWVLSALFGESIVSNCVLS